VINLRCGL